MQITKGCQGLLRISKDGNSKVANHTGHCTVAMDVTCRRLLTIELEIDDTTSMT